MRELTRKEKLICVMASIIIFGVAVAMATLAIRGAIGFWLGV